MVSEQFKCIDSLLFSGVMNADKYAAETEVNKGELTPLWENCNCTYMEEESLQDRSNSSTSSSSNTDSAQRVTDYQKRLMYHEAAGTLAEYRVKERARNKKNRMGSSEEDRKRKNKLHVLRQARYRERCKQQKRKCAPGDVQEKAQKDDHKRTGRPEKEGKRASRAAYMRMWRRKMTEKRNRERYNESLNTEIMSANQGGGVDIREYVKMYTNDEPGADADDVGAEATELPGIQVKFEVEDPEYDHSIGPSAVTAGLLRSFHTPQAKTSSQSAADWTGSSAIRTELRKIMEDKSVDSSTATQNVQNVIENLLKKNENLLAQNDALGFKPHSRRGRPALEGNRSKDVTFPTFGQSVTFPTGQLTQGHVTVSANRQNPVSDPGSASTHLGQLMRPKSPTRRCSIPEKDKSHFNLALMESKVGCEEGEEIFRVQEHEMVCAISSQTKFLNKDGRLVSSVDINYYWCNFCNYSTTNKTFLMQHIMEHRFHCKHCRYQSFSRADVIRHSVHTHPTFQDTASVSQYCILLSDYLRIHNPSEIQLDHGRKRKDPPSDDGNQGEEPLAKSNKSIPKKDMVQKSYSVDFDLFDVSVEESRDRSEEEGGSGASQEGGSKPSSASSSVTVVSSPAASGSQPPPLVSSLVSQPMAAVTQPCSAVNGDQPIITQVFSASTLPPTLAPDVPPRPPSPSPTPPPPPLYPNSVGAGAMQQIRSNLYWSCGYCSFTSTSQSGIKEHSVLQHSGKPHRYVALIKSEGGMSSSPPTTGGSADPASDCEVTMETEKAPQTLDDSPDKAEEPPVLVKQEALETEESCLPIKVRFPTPRIQSKESTVLKCFHCDYSTRNLGPLRNHILNRHRGKSLVGVGGVSSRVFMCVRSDCTFRSSSGQTFLTHSQDCTPWLTAETTDETVTSHLKKCLEATIRIAEETKADLSSSAAVSGSSSATPSVQVSYDPFSCLYCNCQFTWSKMQIKLHVLQCHSAKCLIMRDVKAHRSRKRSCVFFCRWCPWEGTSKGEHDVHTKVCPPALDDDLPEGTLYGGLEHDSSTLEGFENAGERIDKGLPLAIDSDEDLGPPDITRDEDTVDRLYSACPDLTADISTAESNLQCKTFLSDGVPQLYISDPNVVDSDDSIEAVLSDSSHFKGIANDKHHPSLAQRKLQKSKSGTKKESIVYLQCGNDVRKKVKQLQNKPPQASFSTSKHRHTKKKMTEVQCFLCGFKTDMLRSLKLHMQDKHHQHVSFSFRSLYHSSLHLKCRFFVCPMLDCTVYRYNEGDVVNHYRQCHSTTPHQYLDPCYSPAPVKFQRRMNKQRKGETEKCETPDLISQTGWNPDCAEREELYLCLYCDQYHYSDSISKMKAHYLSVHPSMPVVVRDVIAFRNKKPSRVSVCENIHCDFISYVSQRLEEHAATVHSDQWEIVRGNQVMQCTSCGWVTTDDSLVHIHLTTVHAGERTATMVTLNSDDDPCV